MSKIFMVAGESSGDKHGGRIASKLIQNLGCDVVGIGGKRMQEAGVRLLRGLDGMQVMGFAEVARKMAFFRRLFQWTLDKISAESPDILFLVDFPGFNIRLGRKVKRSLGIPVIQYVAPQVWAWRSRRARNIAQSVDHLLVIFPFEVPLFKQYMKNVHFVGHPLIDELDFQSLPTDAIALRKELGIASDRRVIGVLPGSRQQEVSVLLPIYLMALSALKNTGVDFVALLSLPADFADSETIRGIPFEHRVLSGSKSPDVPIIATASDACVVTSGTATLEAALAGSPLVVCYKTGCLSSFIAKRFINIPTVGLVNIISGKPCCPELVQDALSPTSLAGVLHKLLIDSPSRSKILENLKNVKTSLGEPGSFNRISNLVESLLD